MCNWFSCLVMRDGSIKFTEQDSHEALIDRLNLNDTGDPSSNKFVRVEAIPQDKAEDMQHPSTSKLPVGKLNFSIILDEDETPKWVKSAWTERTAEIAKKLWEVKRKTATAYNKAEKTLDEDYNILTDKRRETLSQKMAQAEAEYVAACQQIEGYVPENYQDILKAERKAKRDAAKMLKTTSAKTVKTAVKAAPKRRK